MIVAMHITSESGDHYLELFVDKSLPEIEKYLWGKESFYGCSIYWVSSNASDKEDEDLEKMVDRIEENSWSWG